LGDSEKQESSKGKATGGRKEKVLFRSRAGNTSRSKKNWDDRKARGGYRVLSADVWSLEIITGSLGKRDVIRKVERSLEGEGKKTKLPRQEAKKNPESGGGIENAQASGKKKK